VKKLGIIPVIGLIALVAILLWPSAGVGVSSSGYVSFEVTENQAQPGDISPTPYWRDFYGLDSIYLGQPLPIGAMITAYDPEGTLCGQFEVKTKGLYGIMPVYGDDSLTPEDEGAVNGDLITFRVNKILAKTDIPALWTDKVMLTKVELVANEGKPIQIDDTTYEMTIGSERIEVGDKGSENFKPHAKIFPWPDIYFSLELPTPLATATNIEGDTIKYIGPDWEAHFYQDGRNFEFEVIFNSPPPTNTITFPIDYRGLAFHYQGELTPEEIAEGHIRPDNVVGSYAVYHEEQTGFLIDGVGGKAFHIYTPLANDEEWCDLNIDTKTKELTITIDPTWLATARYPLILDPTFGLDSQGGTTDTSGENRIKGSWDTAPSGGVAESINIWCDTDTAAKNIKGGLYTWDTDSNPTTRLDYTADQIVASVEPALQYHIPVIVGYTIVSSTKYFLLAWGEADGGSTYFFYDSVSNKGVYRTETYNGWPADLDGLMTGIGRQYSVSCDFGAAPPDISNTPPTWGVGVVAESATPATGLTHFTVTNNSGFAVDISIKGTDMTGGTAWELSEDGNAGVDIVGLKAGLSGGSYNIVIKEDSPYNDLVTSLADSGTQDWGMQMFVPTSFSDGVPKSGTVTLTASAS